MEDYNVSAVMSTTVENGRPTPPPSRLVKEGSFPKEPHYHVDERGFAVKCYHSCKTMLMNWQFWAGLTMGFPLEHLLWEKVWPFYLITKFMGL